MKTAGKILGTAGIGIATGGLAILGRHIYKKRKKIRMEKEAKEAELREHEENTMGLVEANEQMALNYVINSDLYMENSEAFKNIMAGVKTINEMKAENKRVEIEKEKAEDEKKNNKKTFIHRVLVDGVWISLTTALAWFGFAFEQTGSMTSKTLGWIHQRFPKRFGTLN